MAKSLEEIEQEFRLRAQTGKDEIKKPDKKEKERIRLDANSDEKPDVNLDEKPDVNSNEKLDVNSNEKPDVNFNEKPDVNSNEKPDVNFNKKLDEEKQASSEGQHRKKRNQRAAIVSDAIFYGALVAMVLCAILFSRNGVGSNSFGGYQYFEVLTTSMQSVYPRGSLVLVKQVNTDGLEVGDDITYYKDSTTSVTHRIIEVKTNYDENGSRGFLTKGVENAQPDSGVVDEKNVVGKVIYHVPKAGAALSWLGENLWLVLVIFLSLLACSFFLKIFFRETKKVFKADGADQIETRIEK